MRHPPLLAESSLESELRLSLIPGVGPLLRMALLDHFGTAAHVLHAPPSQLRQVRGVGSRLLSAFAAARQIDVQQELQRCQDHQIELVLQADPRYPRLLRTIHDPPGLLYLQGQLQPIDELAIAIVGTRHATAYGLRQTERLSAALGRMGMTIVSGLARGVDRMAHEAALAAGARTVAVLGGGLLRIFPADHQSLAHRIRAHGALLSENPPCYQPTRSAFPRRNRLITGLSLGLIVVEASERSGALISARHALEQGREVFAVPGCVDSRMSRGCHQLLKDGAKLVATPDDVFQELGPLMDTATSVDGRTLRHPAELQLNDQERGVLDCVDQEPTSIDAIIRASSLPVHRVLATISVLEMRRLVRRIGGTSISRN